MNNEFNLEEYNDYIKKFFKESPQLFEKLKKLNDKKLEIKRLKKEFGSLKNPIVITVSGTPRAGKTTCIDNLFEFLRKANLNTSCVSEPAGLIYSTLNSQEEKKKLLSNRVAFVEKQWEVGYKCIMESLQNSEIAICDRGIIDTFIWYQMYYKLGMITEKKYQEYFSKLSKLQLYQNNFYALMTESYESMQRDYINSLSIEPRTTMNEKNVELYNEALLDILPTIQSSINYTKVIDTTNCDKMEASIIVANEVLDSVKKLYFRR
ncbi:MAG: AAA family ATPase [Bacilli bacterium]|nr:AAA family ATPase [Bacilli bacterium]